MIVIDGHLEIGEDATSHEKFHTLVLTSQDGEDGVQLTKPDTSTGETRFVLIAGEPLDQEVVQVCPILLNIGKQGGTLMNSTVLSYSIPRGKLWKLLWISDRARMGLKMLWGGRARLESSSGVRFRFRLEWNDQCRRFIFC
jgi:hypothetical protein